MSFKYIDPGYGWGFFSYHLVNVTGNIYNPKHGIAFYSLKEEDGCSIYLTDSSTRLTDFWLKFDIFLPETVYATSYIYNASSLLLEITQLGTNFQISAFGDNNLVLKDTNGDTTNLKAGKINTIWLHVKTGSTWYITASVNGEYIFNESSSSEESGTTDGSFNFTINAAQPVSNVIISDEEIDPKETIAEVGNSAVEATMLENDGTYSSAQVGDYVLQTLDTAALYSIFGSDSKVTSLVAIAAPAFTTGEEVTRIRCRTVDGEIVTDYPIYDKIDTEWEAILEGEAVAAEGDFIPLMAKQLDLASDTTFASLNGLKVGWVIA